MNIGKHHPDGMFAMMGPHVVRQSGLRMHITDILPTLLLYSGLPVNSDLDGRVHTELFDEELRSRIDKSDVKTEVLPPDRTDAPDRTYSSSDEQLLQQRLRDLGYME
jgi:predicted AlkP superfamily phosphohydrolase/phosphomutase